MKNRKSFRSNIFLILILFLTIGFSYVTSTLVMSGNVSYKKVVPMVKFSDICNENISGGIIEKSAIDYSSKNEIDFSFKTVINDVPTYDLYFTIENNSDDKIDISKLHLDYDSQGYMITYSFNYIDNDNKNFLYSNNVINYHDYERIHLNIEMGENGLFRNEITFNFSLSLDYEIADSNSAVNSYNLSNKIIKYSREFSDDYVVSTPDELKGAVKINLPATDQTPAITSYRYVGGNPNNYVRIIGANDSRLFRIISYDEQNNYVSLLYDDYVGPYNRVEASSDEVFRNFSLMNFGYCISKYTTIYDGSGTLLDSFSGDLALQYYQYERSGGNFDNNFYSLLYPSDVLFASKYTPYYGINGGPDIYVDYPNYNWIINKHINNDDEFLFNNCHESDETYCSDGYFVINSMNRVIGVNFNHNYSSYVRPVVFIDNSLSIDGGMGTLDDPYIVRDRPC